MPETNNEKEIAVALATMSTTLTSIDAEQKATNRKLDSIHRWIYGDDDSDGAKVRISRLEGLAKTIVWAVGVVVSAAIVTTIAYMSK